MASLIEQRERWGLTTRLAAAAGVAALAFVLGLALAVVGGRFGPMLMLVLPLGAIAGAAVLARPVLGIAAVYASFPASFVSLPTDDLGLQAAEITVMLVVAIIVFRRLGMGHTPLPWSPPMWWGVLFIAWALLATPGALDLSAAMKQDAQLVGAFLFTLAVLAACSSLDRVRTLIGALLVVGSGVAAYGLRDVSSVRSMFGGAVVVNRAEGVFPQPNDLGAFAAILLMVALGWIFGARSAIARASGLAAAAVASVALALSLSRGAWVGTFLAGLFLLILLPQARRALLTVGLPAVLLGSIALAVVDLPDAPQVEVVRERFQTFANPGDNPYDNRPAIYREALREIGTDPWTGQGPGNFPTASARAASPSRTVGAIHAHNVLLTVASEIGLPGAGLLIGFTIALGVTLVRAVRRLADRRSAALIAGVGAALVAQLGQGIVDFNLRNPVLLLLAASLVGMILVARRELARQEQLEGAAAGSPEPARL